MLITTSWTQFWASFQAFKTEIWASWLFGQIQSKEACPNPSTLKCKDGWKNLSTWGLSCFQLPAQWTIEDWRRRNFLWSKYVVNGKRKNKKKGSFVFPVKKDNYIEVSSPRIKIYKIISPPTNHSHGFTTWKQMLIDSFHHMGMGYEIHMLMNIHNNYMINLNLNLNWNTYTCVIISFPLMWERYTLYERRRSNS